MGTSMGLGLIILRSSLSRARNNILSLMKKGLKVVRFGWFCWSSLLLFVGLLHWDHVLDSLHPSPTQAAIREDSSLSFSQFSMFGSIITIGAMFRAITSGRMADVIDRKGAMRMAAVICIAGWLVIYLSEECE